MAKNFKGLVFEPFKEGIVKEISKDMFKEIVGDEWEIVPYSSEDKISLVRVENGAYNKELKRHRGISGTFILVAEKDFNHFQDLTDSQIKKLKEHLDDLPQYSSSNKYLQVFFEEKDLELKIFHYERGQNVIPVTNFEIIEKMLASDDKSMLKKAENILRQIDFANGDINHFLEHMGNGIADEISQICEEKGIIII